MHILIPYSLQFTSIIIEFRKIIHVRISKLCVCLRFGIRNKKFHWESNNNLLYYCEIKLPSAEISVVIRVPSTHSINRSWVVVF